MINYAELIKHAVTMEQIAQAALPTEKIVRHRIPCPFHDGKNNNLRLYKNSYYCFVCHESGDEIKFIEKLFNMDFMNSMRWISDQFNLGLFDEARNRFQMERKSRRIVSLQNEARGNYSEVEYQADRRSWNDAVNSEKFAIETHRKWIERNAPKDPDDDWKVSFRQVREREEMTAAVVERSQRIQAETEERMDRYERS